MYGFIGDCRRFKQKKLRTKCGAFNIFIVSLLLYVPLFEKEGIAGEF